MTLSQATSVCLAVLLASLGSSHARGATHEETGKTTYPLVSEKAVAIDELRVTENAYAAIRKPPGDGPFPAVIFLHGGMVQSTMKALRENSLRQPTQARFLAWGFVSVNATRRAHRDDPEDRGVVTDTLDLLAAVRKLPYVDPTSVALYGGSGGGTLSLEVASVTNDLAAVVAGEPATVIYMGMFTKEHIDFDANGSRTGDRRRDIINADPKKLYTAELREKTRRKLKGLQTPVLILHGDVHALKKFNFGVFLPEMQALGKSVEVKQYAGEPHGFYWGRGRDPAKALKANRDAAAFLREHFKAKPEPIKADLIEQVEVKPMTAPDTN